MGPVVHTNGSPEYGQKLMVVDEQLFMLAVDEDNGWQLNLFDESNLLSNDFLDLFSDDSEELLSTFWEWFSIENRVFYRNSSHSLGMINARSASHQSFADVLAQNEANVDLDILDIEEFQASSDGTNYFLYGGSEKQAYSYDAMANLAMTLSGGTACQDITRYLVWDLEQLNPRARYSLANMAYKEVCSMTPSNSGMHFILESRNNNSRQSLWYLDFDSSELTNPTANCCSDAEISYQRLLPPDAQFFNNRLYHAFTRERMYVYTPASGAYGAMHKPGSEGAVPIGNQMTLGEGRFYCVGEVTLWRLQEEGGDSLEIAKFMLQGDLSGGRSSYRSWRSDPDILYHDNCLYVTADMPGTGTELVQVNLITPLEFVIIGPNSVNAGSRGFLMAVPLAWTAVCHCHINGCKRQERSFILLMRIHHL